MKEDHRSLVMTEDAAMHMSDNYMARSRTTVNKWRPPCPEETLEDNQDPSTSHTSRQGTNHHTSN